MLVRLTRWVLLNAWKLHSVLCGSWWKLHTCSVLILLPGVFIYSHFHAKSGLDRLSVEPQYLFLCCVPVAVWPCVLSQTGLLRRTGRLCLWKCSNSRLLLWRFHFTLKGGYRRIFIEFCALGINIIPVHLKFIKYGTLCGFRRDANLSF